MKIAITLAALLLSTAAFAQNNNVTDSTANANALTNANNAGVQTEVNFNSARPSTIVRNTPGLGSAVYPVSNSPKSCNSAVGGSLVAPGAGGMFSQTSHGHSCEMLLIYDAMMSTHNMHQNMAAAGRKLLTEQKDLAPELRALIGQSIEIAETSAAQSLQAGYDHMCMVSIVSKKLLTARGMCSPITELLWATGAVDQPIQKTAGTNDYAP